MRLVLTLLRSFDNVGKDANRSNLMKIPFSLPIQQETFSGESHKPHLGYELLDTQWDYHDCVKGSLRFLVSCMR